MTAPKPSPEQLRAALAMFIKSGSANGQEEMRAACLKAYDCLAAENKWLREALENVLRAARCQIFNTKDFTAAMSTGKPLAEALNAARAALKGEEA